LIPGAVTPLGVLNDKEHKVKVYLDKDFLNAPKRIGVHPNDNTATVWLNTEDLVEIIQSHGTELEWAEL
jgi:Ala-tRNA(Pro) deacylase